MDLRFYQRAYAMMGSDKARAAFDLAKQEPNHLRDDYGRNAHAGQRMLLARRLVEAGCALSHSLTVAGTITTTSARESANQMPNFDRAFATLSSVIFHRAACSIRRWFWSPLNSDAPPQINKNRRTHDHYPKVFSIVMAGGGDPNRVWSTAQPDPTGTGAGLKTHSPCLIMPRRFTKLLGIDWEENFAGWQPAG